jgi:hypothetical protein
MSPSVKHFMSTRQHALREFQEFYQRSLAKGIKPTMVRLTLARKIAAITLTLWKKGEDFDINKLNSQAA